MQRSVSTAADIHVRRVPRHAVAAALRNPDLRALLARGFAAAQVDDIMPSVFQMMTGERQLWVVFCDDSKPLAAWTTTINRKEDGSHWLGVAELAGTEVRRWAGRMSDRMAAFAAAEGCERVIFFGRRAWGRLARNVRVIGGDGEICLFERAVS